MYKFLAITPSPQVETQFSETLITELLQSMRHTRDMSLQVSTKRKNVTDGMVYLRIVNDAEDFAVGKHTLDEQKFRDPRRLLILITALLRLILSIDNTPEQSTPAFLRPFCNTPKGQHESVSEQLETFKKAEKQLSQKLRRLQDKLIQLDAQNTHTASRQAFHQANLYVTESRLLHCDSVDIQRSTYMLNINYHFTLLISGNRTHTATESKIRGVLSEIQRCNEQLFDIKRNIRSLEEESKRVRKTPEKRHLHRQLKQALYICIFLAHYHHIATLPALSKVITPMSPIIEMCSKKAPGLAEQYWLKLTPPQHPEASLLSDHKIKLADRVIHDSPTKKLVKTMIHELKKDHYRKHPEDIRGILESSIDILALNSPQHDALTQWLNHHKGTQNVGPIIKDLCKHFDIPIFVKGVLI